MYIVFIPDSFPYSLFLELVSGKEMYGVLELNRGPKPMLPTYLVKS